MAEIRFDPVTGRPVIIAPERALRPDEFVRAKSGIRPLDCPFCVGHESYTPEALASFSADGKQVNGANGTNGSRLTAIDDWLVRVVPNKFPALAEGAHEVIVETPRHVGSLSDLTPDEARATFVAFRQRLLAVAAKRSFRAASIFKNVGPDAGASLEHSHSQLLALPFVPPLIEEELSGAQAYHAKHGRCVFCDLSGGESRFAAGVVRETRHFVALCPAASRFAFEIWVLPRVHACQFESTSQEQLAELARLMQEMITRLEHLLGRVAYNFFIHSAPFDNRPHDHYHWHIELFPRQARLAGFELSTQCYINSQPPEDAAAMLRGNG